MARLVDGEMSLKCLAYKTHIAHEIEQFVACRLIGVIGVGSVENTVMYAELGGILVEGAFQATKLTAAQLLVDIDQRVVEAAALDEVEVQQRLYLMKEHKGAARCHLCGILRQAVEMRLLASDDAFREINDAIDREIVGRSDIIDRARVLILKMKRLSEHESLALSLLLTDAHMAYLLQPGTSGAVEDGHLAAVKFDDSIVNLAAVECRHEVLDGGNTMTAGAYSGATGGLAHIGSQSGLGDDVEAVCATEGDAKIDRCRPNCDSHSPSCVEAGACEAEFLL